MKGVAFLASKMGYEVTGCDLEKEGHDAGHIKDADLLLVTPAVFYQNAKHSELAEGQRREIVITWQEFLGKHLLKDKKVIAIAGTHGKSTTTAMAGKLLIDAGLDPIVVVGARVPGWNGNSRFGEGEYAVVEADEFNNNFLNYNPEIIIINNIEFDHPDFFKDENEVRESFEKFTKKLTGRKILITEEMNPGKKFNLKIPGAHNQKNANMVYLLGQVLGISEDKIIGSIESFGGIGRRMELIAEKKGIKIYDDYAHHPTAIEATLEALRELYPEKRIWAVIEPHGFIRTQALLENYRDVFENADKVIIGPIFKARDKETFGMMPGKIAEASGHPDVRGAKSIEEIKEIISNETESGDIIIVMGAGKSNIWAQKLISG